MVFLSRLFLKALLEVRNDVLARSIRAACQDSITAAAATGAAGGGGGGGDIGAVVAVLGAAHLNGVQMRLMEEAGEGDGAAGWWVEATAGGVVGE